MIYPKKLFIQKLAIFLLVSLVVFGLTGIYLKFIVHAYGFDDSSTGLAAEKTKTTQAKDLQTSVKQETIEPKKQEQIQTEQKEQEQTEFDDKEEE